MFIYYVYCCAFIKKNQTMYIVWMLFYHLLKPRNSDMYISWQTVDLSAMRHVNVKA